MKAIVSVLGTDKKGIIASVGTALYELGANVEDINQTIMQSKYFTMIMVIDLPDETPIEQAAARLNELGASLGIDIRIQHTDIFNSMHRI